jgi:thiol:disulfide interchange protein
MRWLGSSLVVVALSGLSGCGKSLVAQEPTLWETDHVAALARSAREQRLLFVYVGAEWDTAAKELDHETFSDARVRAALRSFVNLHIDMTDDEAPSTVSATQRFKIIGEPALLVLAPDGETELVRIHEFVPPARLLAVLREALAPDAIREAQFEAAARKRLEARRWMTPSPSTQTVLDPWDSRDARSRYPLD